MSFRLFLLAFCGLSLVACSTITPQPTPHHSTQQALQQQHLAALANITHFQLQGRIGVQVSGKGFSGGMVWQHTSQLDALAFLSPFGGKVAELSQTPQGAVLTDANGYQIQADNAEALLQTLMGWKVPLTGLADWSLGRPTQGVIEEAQWDDAGKLSRLKQQGWEIQYLAYQPYTMAHAEVELPSKIELRNEKAFVRLVIETRQ